MTENGEMVTAVTPFDDDGDGVDYKWSEVRDRLGLTSNVANARWMPEKLLPILEGLRTPKLLTSKGRPTKFGAQMLARYKLFCLDNGGDYEAFHKLVKKAFGDGGDGFGDRNGDAAKPVAVEVLGFGDRFGDRFGDGGDGFGDGGDGFGDGGDKRSSPLARFAAQVGDREEDMETKIMRAAQAKQAADRSIAQLGNLEAKSWEQHIVEDELGKYTEVQLQRKKEADIRLHVRSMLEGNDSTDRS